MALNFEEEGFPLAVIKGGDKAKGKKKRGMPIIYLAPNDRDLSAPQYELSLPETDDSKFQLIPNPDKERQIHYVTGQSGSGKSYFCKQYCLEYQKMFPEHPIIMFSSLGEDETLDSLPNFHRIKLKGDGFMDEDFDIDDFKDSLVIFDDHDCIREKKLRDKVIGILDMILETGRHTNTYCLVTNHIACNGKDTKRILNECNSITFFPSTITGRAVDYLCNAYLGMRRDEIERAMSLPSRHVTVTKSYPKAVMGEKDIYILSQRKKRGSEQK